MSAVYKIVGLSKAGAAWIEQSPTQSAVWQDREWSTQQGNTDISEQLQSIRKSLGKSRVVWSLGPDLVQHWIQKFPVGVSSLAELQAVAQARAMNLFPDTGSREPWAISADWKCGEDVLCTALPGDWHSAISPVMELGNSQIQTPLSWALGRKSDQIPQSGWIAISTFNELYVLYRLKGQCLTLRKVRLPIEADAELVQSLVSAEWKRERMKHAGKPEMLTWLDLADEAGHAPLDSAKLVQLKPPRLGTQGLALRMQRTDSDARKMAWLGTAMSRGVLA